MFSLVLAISTIPIVWAANGQLKITTKPSGANLYINGKLIGNSAAHKSQTFTIELRAGQYEIEAIKETEGAMQWYGQTSEIIVKEGLSQSLSLNLKPRAAAGFKAVLAMKYPSVLPIPKMVNIPAGQFKMGCASGKNCNKDEKPLHSVSITAFAMSATEVTFEQWDACVEEGGCNHNPEDQGWGRGSRPVINLSFDDVQEYLHWLNAKGKGTFQLPSEDQWEYAARAGSTSQYSWGNSVGENNANCDGCGSQWDHQQTAPVGSFKANHFGLYDMHGNVREWVQDCWHSSYNGAANHSDNACTSSVLRGGAWYFKPKSMRAAYRSYISREYRSFSIGFRLSSSAEKQSE
jgi:formylglycine-generating enzyme required for sulfatase activity